MKPIWKQPIFLIHNENVVVIKIKNKKDKKKIKKSKDKKSTSRKLVLTASIATICFAIITGNLGRLIFVKGQEYSEAAYNRQMKNQIISPKRGIIYDANGNVLAKNIPVDTISVNPGKVSYSNKKEVENEVLAQGLAQCLELDYNEVLQKVSGTSSVAVIAKKVDQTKTEVLRKWMGDNKITAGINIDEDTKRYYPYDNVASNLLGICGDSNSGIVGLEECWNETLTGTVGKIVTVQDVNKNPISDEMEQYVPVENGSNLYLTIDLTVQQIAEKYLKQAVEQNACSDGGNVIVMNPQNGEILAMASCPDYNLNIPYAIEPTGQAEVWNTLPTEEKTSAYFKLWTNKSVSKLYEPGSTFKIITAAVALEENITQMDMPGDFMCTGAYQVEDRTISCWRANPHGAQSLREALCNSCNPAFMQLGQRIGATTLYRYYEAFGLFDLIGKDIAKTYDSVFHKLENVGKVELATISFGQRFEISPLQLITAVSAVANDGVLVEPKIVKQVENADTGVIEVQQDKEVRQVVSKETSEKIKNMMESVVVQGTGRHAAVEGYTIGGKSGTSEPMAGNEDAGYVASFVAISPIENTQVVVLVVLYNPNEGTEYHQGGQTAGPVAANIMSEVLPYLGLNKNGESVTTAEISSLTVPNVSTKTVDSAREILQTYGFTVKVNGANDENTNVVLDQMPKSGAVLEKGGTVYLYSEENEPRLSVKVPSVAGLTVGEARQTLADNHLNIKMEGEEGVIVSQEPVANKSVEEGTIVDVVIQKKED